MEVSVSLAGSGHGLLLSPVVICAGVGELTSHKRSPLYRKKSILAQTCGDFTFKKKRNNSNPEY